MLGFGKKREFETVKDIRKATGREYDDLSDQQIADGYFNTLINSGEEDEENRSVFMGEFLRESISPNNRAFNNIYDISTFRKKTGKEYEDVDDDKLSELLFNKQQRESPILRGPRDFARQMEGRKSPGKLHRAFDAGVFNAAMPFFDMAKGYAQSSLNSAELDGTEAPFASSVLDAAEGAEEWLLDYLDHSREDADSIPAKLAGTITQMGAWIGASALAGAAGAVAGGPAGAITGPAAAWAALSGLSYGVHQNEAVERAIAVGATPEQIETALHMAAIPAILEVPPVRFLNKTLKPVFQGIYPRLTGKQSDDIVESIKKISENSKLKGLNRVRHTGTAAGFEGGQEATSQVIHNYIEMGYNPDPELAFMDGALESAIWGAWGGGFFGGIRDYSNYRQGKRFERAKAEIDKKYGGDNEVAFRKRAGHGAMSLDLENGDIQVGSEVYVGDEGGYASIPATVQSIEGDRNSPMIRYITQDGEEGVIDGFNPEGGGFLLSTPDEIPEQKVEMTPEDKRFLKGLDGRRKLAQLVLNFGKTAQRLTQNQYQDEDDKAADIQAIEDTISSMESLRKAEAKDGDISYAANMPGRGLQKFLVSWNRQATEVLERFQPKEEGEGDSRPSDPKDGESETAQTEAETVAETAQETEETVESETEPESGQDETKDTQTPALTEPIETNQAAEQVSEKMMSPEAQEAAKKAGLTVDTQSRTNGIFVGFRNKDETVATEAFFKSDGHGKITPEQMAHIAEWLNEEALAAEPSVDTEEGEITDDDVEFMESDELTKRVADETLTMQERRAAREELEKRGEEVEELEDEAGTQPMSSRVERLSEDLDNFEQQIKELDHTRKNAVDLKALHNQVSHTVQLMVANSDRKNASDQAAIERGSQLVRIAQNAAEKAKKTKDEDDDSEVDLNLLTVDELRERSANESLSDEERTAAALEIAQREEDEDISGLSPSRQEAAEILQQINKSAASDSRAARAAGKGSGDYKKALTKILLEKIKKSIKDSKGKTRDYLKEVVIDGKRLRPSIFSDGYFATQFIKSYNLYQEAEKRKIKDQVRGLAGEALEAALGETTLEFKAEKEAYATGWWHSIKGGTRSNLPTGAVEPQLHEVMLEGLMAATEWKEQNPDAFKVRKQKQDNSGVTFKRIADLKNLMNRDVKENHEIGNQIEKVIDEVLKINRGDLFNPFIPDDATPGVSHVIGLFTNRANRYGRRRDRILSPRQFIEKMVQEQTEVGSWLFRHSKNTKVALANYIAFGGATHMSNILEWSDSLSMLSVQRKERLETWADRAEQVMEWYREYADKVNYIARSLDGAKTLKELEDKIQNDLIAHGGEQLEAVMDKDSAEDIVKKSEFVRQSGKENEETETTEKKKLIRFSISFKDLKRSGMTDHRKGKDITPDKMRKTFGFTGVQTGEYVNATEQQDHLNYAYDAFMDLAEFWGIKPEQIGFGRMAFTVGTLGKGGKAMAFFYPAYPETDSKGQQTGRWYPLINVTKNRGDGTVAHEYGHAVDFLMRIGNLAEMNRNRQITRDDSMVLAVQQMLTVMQSSTVMTAENAERALKDFVEGSWHYKRRDSRYEASPVGWARQNLENRLNAVERFKKSGHYNDSFLDTSDYYRESNKLGEYWVRPEELFARAVEARVYDWLQENNARNDYLVNEWVSDSFLSKDTGYRGQPYPQGNERKHINAALDIFRKHLTIREDGYPEMAPEFFDEIASYFFNDYEQALREALDELPKTQAEYDQQKGAIEARRAEKENKRRQAEIEKLKADIQQDEGPPSDPETSDKDREDVTLEGLLESAEGVFTAKKEEAAAKDTETRKEPKIRNFIKVLHPIFRDRIFGEGKPMDSKEFFELADAAFGGSRVNDDAYDVREAYDAMEIAFATAAREKLETMKHETLDDAKAAVKMLWEAGQLLPTQSIRTDIQIAAQQFSTPTHISYAMTRVAHIMGFDIIVEPSAGTGIVGNMAAVWNPKKIILNELETNRYQRLLEAKIPNSVVYNFDAQHISARGVLPAKDGRPTLVLMNPPFSSDMNVQKRRNTSRVGMKHVAEAMKKLAPGGRLVALVGRGFSTDAPSLMKDWQDIQKKYTVRANIELTGKLYYKHGTQFDNRLVVIDKVEPTGEDKMLHGSLMDEKQPLEMLFAAMEALEPVRNDRPEVKEETKPPPKKKEPKEKKEETEKEGDRKEKISAAIQDAKNRGVSALGKYAEGLAKIAEYDDKTMSSFGNLPFNKKKYEEAKPIFEAAYTDLRASGLSLKKAIKEMAGWIADNFGEVMEKMFLHWIKIDLWPRVQEENNGDLEHESEPKQDYDGPAVERHEKPQTAVVDDEILREYHVETKAVNGIPAQKHKARLMESTALSGVPAPERTYELSRALDKPIKTGDISDAQLDAVIAAMDSHQTVLPNGKRQAMLIGDDAGLGKTRIIIGSILEYFASGGKTVILISANADGLYRQFIDDWSRMMGTPEKDIQKIVSPMRRWGPNETIELGHEQKVIFGSYNALGRLPGRGSRSASRTRREQIVEAARREHGGRDPDPLIIFDEAHKMAHAIDGQGGPRGARLASNQGREGLALINDLPLARVIFLSATMANDIKELAVAADRLGITGQGTPFPDVTNFVDKISSHVNKLFAMEMVTKDLKAAGVYMARMMDFSGVKFERLHQDFNEGETAMLDIVAKTWKNIYPHLDDAIDALYGDPHHPRTRQQKQKARQDAENIFFSTVQRTYVSMIMSLGTDRLIRDIEEHLEQGMSVVVQLDNTNEAAMDRQLDAIRAEVGTPEFEEALQNIDVSPRSQVEEFLWAGFPQFELVEDQDEDGNVKMVEYEVPALDEDGNEILDAEGNPVMVKAVNEAAAAIRDALLEELAYIQVPDSPIDRVVSHFGADLVTEMTGRSKRILTIDGRRTLDPPGDTNRTDSVRAKELEEFNNAETLPDGTKMGRRVLIFSQKKGGTGMSYHNSLDYKNQDDRYHMVFQPGWEIKNAVQSSKRTNRTNQKSFPVITLYTTNSPAHKRMTSAIAKGISALGALQSGDRNAQAGGIISEDMNIDNTEALQTLIMLIQSNIDGEQGAFREFSPQSLRESILWKVVDDKGRLKNDLKMKSFLNRIALLPHAEQVKMMDGIFLPAMQMLIENKRAAGTYDEGMDIIAPGRNNVESATIGERKKIFESGKATAHYVRVDLEKTINRLTLQKYFEFWDPKDPNNLEQSMGVSRFLYNTSSKRIWMTKPGLTRFADGNVRKRTIDFYTPGRMRGSNRDLDKVMNEDTGEYKAGWQEISFEEGAKLWEEELEQLPKTELVTEHVIEGAALLKAFDRLPERGVRGVQVFTDEGTSINGMLVSEDDIDATLGRFGVDQTSQYTPDQVEKLVLTDKMVVSLSSAGWFIQRRQVSGEWRMELTIGGSVYPHKANLEKAGAKIEVIQSRPRVFIPKGQPEVMRKILEGKDIIAVRRQKEDAAEILSVAMDLGADRESILLQAEERGFDINLLLYHFTNAPGIKQIDMRLSKYGLFGKAFYASEDRDYARPYGKHELQVYIRKGNTMSMDNLPDKWERATWMKVLEGVSFYGTNDRAFPEEGDPAWTNEMFFTQLENKIAAKYDNDKNDPGLHDEMFDVIVNQMGIDSISFIMTGRGRRPIRIWAVLRPENIRSVDAKFDPDYDGDPRIHFSRAKEASSIDLTDAAEEVRTLFERMNPENAELRLQEGLIRSGDKLAYGRITREDARTIIELSLSGNPVKELHHETFHGVRHLFTSQEWMTMVQEAISKDWIGKYKIRERYAHLFKNGAPTNGAYEEALADALGEFGYDVYVRVRRGETTQDQMRLKWGSLYKLFERILRFFDSVASILRGKGVMRASGATEIFEKIISGEIARRQLRSGNATEQNILNSSLRVDPMKINLFAAQNMAEIGRDGLMMFSTNPGQNGEHVNQVMLDAKNPVLVRVPIAMLSQEKPSSKNLVAMQKAVGHHTKNGADAVVFVSVSPVDGTLYPRMMVAGISNKAKSLTPVRPLKPSDNPADPGWINALAKMLDSSMLADKTIEQISTGYGTGRELAPVLQPLSVSRKPKKEVEALRKKAEDLSDKMVAIGHRMLQLGVKEHNQFPPSQEELWNGPTFAEKLENPDLADPPSEAMKILSEEYKVAAEKWRRARDEYERAAGKPKSLIDEYFEYLERHGKDDNDEFLKKLIKKGMSNRDVLSVATETAGRAGQKLDEVMKRQKGGKKGVLKALREGHLAEASKEFWDSLTLQVTDELPDGAEWARGRDWLGHVMSFMQGLKEQTAREISSWITDLDAENFQLYARIVVLRDAWWDKQNHPDRAHWLDGELEEGEDPITADEIWAELSTYYQTMPPQVAAALEKRTKFMDRMRSELVKHDILKKRDVANEDYFRHKVMDYHNIARMGAGKKLRQSFRTRRRGSEKEILADVLVVDSLTVAAGLKDIEVAEKIKELKRSSYNVTQDVKNRAKAFMEKDLIGVVGREWKNNEFPEEGLVGETVSEAVKNFVERYKLAHGGSIDNLNDDAPFVGAWRDTSEKIRVGRIKLRQAVKDIETLDLAKIPPAIQLWMGESYAPVPIREIQDFIEFLEGQNINDAAGALESGLMAVLSGFNDRTRLRHEYLGNKFIHTNGNLDAVVKALKDRGVTHVGEGGFWNIEDIVAWQIETSPGTNKVFRHVSGEALVSRLQSKIESELIKNNDQSTELENILRENLRGELVVAGLKEQLLLPDKVARAIDEFEDVNITKGIERIAQGFTRLWKPYILHSPMFITRYSFYNILGDLDALIGLMGITNIHRYLNKEAFDAAVRITNKKPGSEREGKFIELRADTSGYTTVEMTSADYESVDKPESASMGSLLGLTKGGKRAFDKYYRGARYANMVRENMFRYAAFNYALDQWESGKDLHEIGAFALGREFRQAARGLTYDGRQLPGNLSFHDKFEIAAEVSRQTLVPYDRPPPLVQTMRNFSIPFIVWQWSVPNRYFRGFAEVTRLLRANEKDIGKTDAAMARVLAVRSLARMLTFTTLVTAAWWLQDDEEEPLPEYLSENAGFDWSFGMADQPYIIQMRGAFPDFLRWIGMSNPVYTIRRIEDGTLPEGYLGHATKEFANQATAGITPAIKLPFELISGQRLFPDITEPRQIDDRSRHAARAFGLAYAHDLGAQMAGNDLGYKTRGSITGSIGSLFATLVKPQMPDISALYQIKGYVRQYTFEELGQAQIKGVRYANSDLNISLKNIITRFEEQDPDALEFAILRAYSELNEGEEAASVSEALRNSKLRSRISKKLEARAPLFGLSKKNQKKFLAERLPEITGGEAQMEVAKRHYDNLTDGIKEMMRSGQIPF